MKNNMEEFCTALAGHKVRISRVLWM